MKRKFLLILAVLTIVGTCLAELNLIDCVTVCERFVNDPAAHTACYDGCHHGWHQSQGE